MWMVNKQIRYYTVVSLLSQAISGSALTMAWCDATCCMKSMCCMFGTPIFSCLTPGGVLTHSLRSCVLDTATYRTVSDLCCLPVMGLIGSPSCITEQSHWQRKRQLMFEKAAGLTAALPVLQIDGV